MNKAQKNRRKSVSNKCMNKQVAIAAVVVALSIGYIAATKKWHLFCPVTYTRMFSSSSSSPPQSSTSPVAAPLRKFTTSELKQHTGEEDLTQIYVSVKGNVYRVSAQYYGPGESYHCFAGTDASRNLAKGIIGKDEADADWRNLSPEHMETLNGWEKRFMAKYAVVGTLVEDEEFKKRGAAFSP